MPSRRQPTGDSEMYDSAAEKMLRTKDAETVVAVVRGIRCEERAREFLGVANRVGVRDRVLEEIVAKVRELSGSGEE